MARQVNLKENNLQLIQVPLLSWKTVFAGLSISVLVALMMTFLGIGIGGWTLSDFTTINEVKNVAIGSSIWLVITVCFSLLAGSYFATRLTHFKTRTVGAAEGLVISALFFILLTLEVGMTVAMVGRGVSSIAGTVGSQAADIASDSQVGRIVQETVLDQTLKDEPTQVIGVVSGHLVAGNTEAARTYLIYQTGMSPTEAQSRLDGIETRVRETATQITEQTAAAVSRAAWLSFVVLLLGTVSAFIGGATGARANVNRPLASVEDIDSRLARVPGV